MPANIKSDWLIKINKQKTTTTTTKREHSCSCSTLGVLKIWGISMQGRTDMKFEIVMNIEIFEPNQTVFKM